MDTVCRVRVIFNNPLCIAVVIDRVVVLIGDKEYDAYETVVSIYLSI
jgi:hypothetical protein